MSRQIDVGPAEFTTVRLALHLTQGEYATRLGVSRRTVIRGEKRGIELPHPWNQDAERKGVRVAWEAARKEAQDSRHNYRHAAESATVRTILERVSANEREQFAATLGAMEPKPAAPPKGASGARPKRKKKLARRMKR